jgi:uncharacterized protein YecT (DUF1311 family)
MLWLIQLTLLLLQAAAPSPKASALDPVPEFQTECKDAKTQQEMNQCSEKEHQDADARLTALYREIAADLSRGKDPTALPKLREAEIAWRRYRDLHCGAARNQFKGASMSAMIWSDCMTGVTLNRIQDLKYGYPVQGAPRP